MPSYKVLAKVNQIVTKEIELIVEAGSEEEAQEKSREALQEYPEPVTVSGVSRIRAAAVKHWIPRDIEFGKIKEIK